MGGGGGGSVGGSSVGGSSVGGSSVGGGGGGSVGVGVPPHAARITAAPSRRAIASHSGHLLENPLVTILLDSPLFLLAVMCAWCS